MSAAYTVNAKALRHWVRERLRLTDRADGSIEAVFMYDGSTCSNMGRALRFAYRVVLGSREQGHEIVDMTCAPIAGDDGHTFMCRYRLVGEDLLHDIAGDKPMMGRPLADVFTWERELIGPGCYCEAESRDHKWGLVLETIHFALAQRESAIPEHAGAHFGVHTPHEK